MSEPDPVITAARAAPKKVRLACRRCRSRRIKCDGQTPACSNCAKAGVACLDVDSQNSHLLIPRNFASAARDRIHWLEDIIRTRLPDVDLTAGPQVDVGAEAHSSPALAQREDDEPPGAVVPSPDVAQRRQSLKRPTETAGSPNSTEAFSEKAHSVAMNLGLVSLNSDSSQKAYLGSSSGRLFADLVGASPPSDPSSTVGTNAVAEPASDLLLDRQFSLQSRYRSLHYVLRQELPKYEDGVFLLQTYIRWIYPDYPVLDPPSLYGALSALYSSSSYNLNDEPLLPNGWPTALEPFHWNGQTVQPALLNGECPPMPVVAFTIFMVFNISAIIKVRSRVYEYSPERYYRLATRFSADCFSRISLATIQALMLQIVHCLHTPAEASVWTLIHVGMAHCVELGLHREPGPGNTDPAAVQQVKRLVFYTYYGLDRSISSIQGRPIGFRDDCFDVKLPRSTSLGTESALQGSSSLGNKDLGYTVSRFELDQIVSEIKTRLYLLPVRDPETRTDDSTASQDDILQKLLRWHDRFAAGFLGNPTSLDGRQKYLWKLKLQIRYHTTMILLFQPSQQIPRPCQESLQTVYDSASVILRDYDLLHKNYGLHHGWRSVQNIFAAGAALVYSVWTSELVQSRASPAELSRSLRSCSSLLSVGGEWWPSVKTSLASFGSVVDLTVQKLYTQGPAAKQARLATARSARRGSLRLSDETSHTTSRPAAREPNPASYRESWAQYGQTQQTTDTDITRAGLDVRDMNQNGMEQAMQLGRDSHGYPLPTGDVAADDELMPEIEYFLADFGRSDFSWSFPLGDVEEPLDPNAFINL